MVLLALQSHKAFRAVRDTNPQAMSSGRLSKLIQKRADRSESLSQAQLNFTEHEFWVFFFPSVFLKSIYFKYVP